ncbi:MAG TPA: erythromycin esterase family protein, partial [Candidatus Eisenbacteria bacterium]|nr:erythromycin esterase family protein [Candidatus Eisenbacteria bacterium]
QTDAEPDADSALAFVRAAAIPFDTAEPGHGFRDLEPLKRVIGDARIVALGEGTHGTHEFFQMKHRLTEFLATEMGFTVFGIEANMPEAARLNGYVRDGRGDPRQLLEGLYFWTWNTQEVLDLIEWMRAFNLSGRGRIEFTGFDMQMPDTAAAEVLYFLRRAERAYADSAAAAYALLKEVRKTPGTFGTATGTFPVAACAGKRIRYFGWIRAQDVSTGFAGLWWRVDGDSATLRFDNMMNRGPRGTTGWTRGEIVLDVPANARNINFGVLLSGPGTAWFDSLAVTIDDQPYRQPPAAGLDFEAGDPPYDLAHASAGYRYLVDSTEAVSGRRSLRISSDQTALKPGPGWSEATAAALAVLRHLEGRRDSWIRHFPAPEVDHAIQTARVVLQATQMETRSSTVTRDQSMAANVRWTLDHSPPGTRMVLWAHNWHVSRSPQAMGSMLDPMFGRDMVVLGFCMGEGRYNAVGGGHLGPHDARVAPPGSVEALLSEAGYPRQILDLRRAPAGSPAAAWFASERPFRNIGALAVDDGFREARISELYDGLIYFDRTTPSVLLKAF